MLFMCVSAVLLVAVVLLSVVNVVLRVAFNAPVRGAIEYVQYGVMLVAALMLSRTSFVDKHIHITIITDKLKPKARGILLAFGRLVSAAFFGIMAYYYFNGIPDAFKTLRATDVLNIPYYYIYLFMGLGFAMGALMFLLQCFQYIQAGFSKNGAVADIPGGDGKLPHEDDPT